MTSTLTPGTRLYGAADATELIVVKAPAGPVDVRIGGHPVVLDPTDRRGDLEVITPADAAPLMGKRYVDADDTIELLCTKAGTGAIAIGETLCAVKSAKPLPSSD